MTYDRESHRTSTIRSLRHRGWFIAAMGVIGLILYWFDIAGAREHWLIVLLGTIFCGFGSLRMFYLARRVKNME